MADVARLAGVGVSTVSRVVRADPRVSPETQHRVHEALQAADYRVDAVARSLRTKHTSIVGFVVSDLANPVFSSIASAAERAFSDRSYLMLLAAHGQLIDEERRVLEDLIGRRVDGVILSTPNDKKLLVAASLHRQGTPVLLLDRQDPNGVLDSIVFDHAAGTLAALRHLVRRGHTGVLLISRPLTILPGRMAREAVKAARQEFGSALSIRFDPGEMSVARAFDIVQRAFKSSKPPTAIIASSNQLQAGVLEGLRELGLQVGEDVSLIGPDDLPMSRLFNPSITALSRDLSAAGQMAARLLIERIEGKLPAKQKTIMLPCVLIERESVRDFKRASKQYGRALGSGPGREDRRLLGSSHG